MLPAKIKSSLLLLRHKPWFIPGCVSSVIAVLILGSVLNLFDFFYDQHKASKEVSRLLEIASVKPPANDLAASVSAERLKKTHVFGHTSSSSSDIPITALNIKLTGIFFSQDQKSSQISIVYDNQPEKLYHENDELPNGAVIDQIFQSEVIIKYNNELQKLVLFQKN